MTPLAWIAVATVALAVAGLVLRSMRRRTSRPRPDSSGEDAARAEALAQISRDIERGRSAGHSFTSQQGTFL